MLRFHQLHGKTVKIGHAGASRRRPPPPVMNELYYRLVTGGTSLHLDQTLGKTCFGMRPPCIMEGIFLVSDPDVAIRDESTVNTLMCVLPCAKPVCCVIQISDH